MFISESGKFVFWMPRPILSLIDINFATYKSPNLLPKKCHSFEINEKKQLQTSTSRARFHRYLHCANYRTRFVFPSALCSKGEPCRIVWYIYFCVEVYEFQRWKRSPFQPESVFCHSCSFFTNAGHSAERRKATGRRASLICHKPLPKEKFHIAKHLPEFEMNNDWREYKKNDITAKTLGSFCLSWSCRTSSSLFVVVPWMALQDSMNHCKARVKGSVQVPAVKNRQFKHQTLFAT